MIWLSGKPRMILGSISTHRIHRKISNLSEIFVVDFKNMMKDSLNLNIFATFICSLYP